MSERMLKTKEVAELLQIAPATVHKWVKKHDIKCSTNDRGHFLYGEEAISKFEALKKEWDDSRKNDTESHLSQVASASVLEKMDIMTKRIEQLEEIIETKADEVVSYQLLKHRQELEEVERKIGKIEERLIEIKMKEIEPQDENGPSKKEKGFLAGLFSV
ncbi:helix-turn-helix domain-containing protein [Thalassorhabdus alkalitolerans]|uniref:Helix-turn-helix domain-containing protein n=2 Tax=Bacillaceae TaxID=186817 RepID=A0ABW0YUI6_9BACI